MKLGLVLVDTHTGSRDRWLLGCKGIWRLGLRLWVSVLLLLLGFWALGSPGASVGFGAMKPLYSKWPRAVLGWVGRCRRLLEGLGGEVTLGESFLGCRLGLVRGDGC